MATKTASSPSASLIQLKETALRLFAERGIDGVTLRQIAEAQGSRNHSALTYHFGSKEALIRELIADGARAIDARRNASLDNRMTAGGPRNVVEVMEILVETAIDPAPPASGECYNRFIAGLQLSNRALFMDALEGRWNSGYLRCLDEVRRLLPDVPPDILNQRLVFLGGAVAGILSGRETELADRSREHPMWSHPETLGRVARALAGIIEY